MVENLFNILLSSTGENIGEYKQHTKAENWNVNAVYPQITNMYDMTKVYDFKVNTENIYLIIKKINQEKQ